MNENGQTGTSGAEESRDIEGVISDDAVAGGVSSGAGEQMTDDGAENTIPVFDDSASGESSPPEPPVYDPYRNLLRLLVGGALVTAMELSKRMRAYEDAYRAQSRRPDSGADQPETGIDLARLAAIGLMFTAYERGRLAAGRAARAGGLMARLGRKAVRPIARNPLVRPARRRIDRLAAKGASEYAGWVNTGRAEENHSQLLARSLFNVSADDIVSYLSTNEEVDKLIDDKVDGMLTELADDANVTALISTQVDQLLPQLAEDPGLQAFVHSVAEKLLEELPEDERLGQLIRKQGDQYLVYLQEENSQQVQVLIQGQSMGLAGEMLNEVRERTVTADNVIESIVRGIMRRRPREELPSPPPEVQVLAEPPRVQLAQDSGLRADRRQPQEASDE